MASTATAGDVQRVFLQAIISRRIVPYNLARALWRKSIESVNAANDRLKLQYSDDRAEWDQFLKRINDSLNALDLEFRHLYDEASGREMYAIVNRKGDEIAQLATEYSPLEIAYFKAIVEQIMLAPREAFSVSSLVALREASALPTKSTMTKTQADAVLGSFVARGWLIKSKRGRYALSTRTLLELQAYLRAAYPDEIIECTICMEIITRGAACKTRACKTRMHDHCLATFRRAHPRTACPACSADWTGAAAGALARVGEEAVRDGDDGSRRTRRAEDAEEDEDEGEEEGEDATQSTQESGGGTQKGKGKKKAAAKGKAKKGKKGKRADSMEVDDDEEEEEEAREEDDDDDDDDTTPS